MAFYTQAIRDGTIDRNLEMSEEEMRNTILARITESNAFERHNMQMHPNKDAKISTIEEEGGFSKMEKSVGKRHEEDMPAITYNANTKNFVVSCNCGKEKFVFDIKNDTVEIESTVVHMKEMDPYKKNNPTAEYGGERSDNDNTYNGGFSRPPSNSSYSNSNSGMKYKN